ncbi:hypothetical protein A9Q84_18085 [Halobacteriovorax marinus]|uniref:Uncharacterized protein n=1 Tax=Halobacteriovorax marinus TaxID=97084 RepID=A0A1Y5F3R4_9BACT|nr:hypothetical protein A9Q84_18085 [Halobacteriovorax marinus]
MTTTNYTPLFYFMNENILLVEVKINELPEGFPVDKIFHWLMVPKATGEISRLKFSSMDDELINGNKMNIRVFENAELRFDEKFAKFQIDGQGNILMNSPIAEISHETHAQIKTFLLNL